MVFQAPSWVPEITTEIPDSVPLGQFVLETTSPSCTGDGETSLFVDGISGRSYSAQEIRQRIEWLSTALASRLGWSPNTGSPWDKVVAIYSLNTIDFFILCWAIHRLNGICLPVNPTSSPYEIISHLTNAKCDIIFTCDFFLETCLTVARNLMIPSDRVFTLPLPEKYTGYNQELVDPSQSLEQLFTEGLKLDPLPPLQWAKGQGRSQVAFFCSTSGTSGKPKLAMLTHYGLIMNVIQWTAFEDHIRHGHPQAVTGSALFTHSYGVVLGHLASWRRDSLVIFPKFDIQLILQAVPKYHVERLYLVPPILSALLINPFLFDQYNLSSITSVFTCAAPLGRDLSDKLHQLQPNWKFVHGYGLTESCVLGTCTSVHDVWPGSSGSLLPQFQIRLVGLDEQEITGYEEAGEIRFISPGLFVGYLGDEEATKNTFDEQGWLCTGDVGLMRRGPQGSEHLFIVDRLKDMIKVKGMQVVPATIETVLLAHPQVLDAAVIGAPDELAGERPMAFVVRSSRDLSEEGLEDLQDELDEWVQNRLHETHWLHDRIVFLAEIPRNGTGKVLRKELRATVPRE